MKKNEITDGFEEIDKVKTKVDSKLLINYDHFN
jgi:hypothetical protein